MRLLCFIISGALLLTCQALAQEDNITTATSSLQEVLSNLKQSVEKLSLNNDQLTARDSAIKNQVLQLQTQLGQLEAQGDVLNRAAAKLQDKNPGRAQQITRMEEENFELDAHAQKIKDSIKLLQQSLGEGGHLQKEKLKLMKMINDSQERQELLNESILEFQKKTSLQPGDQALAHQKLLKKQINDLENLGLGFQWDDTQLRQLETELAALEHNYSQFKSLVEQMSKKSHNTHMMVSEHIEEEKLRGNLDDLKHQGVRLVTELDDLRSQMVDLDKRKSRLEIMIQQMK